MKSLNPYLVTVVAILAYLVFNLVINITPVRWDMTESNQHSVSDETREKLRSLETPVTIRYYASVSENSIPYSLRVFGEKVEYFLDILKQEGQDKVEVIRYDPKPGSEAEETAKFDGISSNFNRNQGRFFFGLSVSCLDRKVKIPFLHPDREEMLEYDILQAIGTVTNSNRKAIGILSSLPVMGGEYSNDRGKGVFPPWLFVNELRKTYNVFTYGEDIDALENNPPEVLIIMHPVNFEEAVMRRVDQYIGNGGKIILMLDPYSGALEMINPSFQKELMSSNFEKFLKAWGINYIPDEVVADMNLRSEVDRGFGPETLHTVLDIPQRYIHKEDPITAGINILGFPYAGHFWPQPAMASRIIPLVSSSKVVSTVKAKELFRLNRKKNEELQKAFKPDERRRVVVAKLMGALNPAYPETTRNNDIGADSCQAILFSDADFVFDPFAGETVQLSKSQSTLKPLNGNLALLSNAVDYLIGDKVMLAARGKGAVRYPLVGLSDLKLEIEGRYEEERLEFQKQQQDIETQINTLSKDESKKDPAQFSAHQKSLNLLFAKREQTEEDLASMDREIDYALQQVKNRFQWANTLVMPLLIFLIGATVIYRRNSHSRAR